MSSWRLATITKQHGQLDKVTEFLPNDKNLKAVEIIVPIDQNIKKAITTADNLVSSAIRSFEIVWDRKEKKLAFWLVSSKSDIENYKDSFRAVYPNAEFSEMEHTVPSWYDKTQEYHVFDASVRHGHFFSLMNYSKYPDLITHISNTVMKSQNGWIQFVFQSYDATKRIANMGMRLDSMYKKVTNHKYRSNWEVILEKEKPHDHPEINGEFARNYKTLRQHSETKVINPQFVMSVRGIISSDVELEFDFEIVQNLAFENINTTFENITKYPYKHSKFFQSNEKKAEYIKIDRQNTKNQRIDIFPLRLLPKPDKLLSFAVSHYVGTNIIGSYHKRKPLPFLVLNTLEMPLFVNLPDATVKHIRLTRGQNMPKSVMNKDGFEIGEIL